MERKVEMRPVLSSNVTAIGYSEFRRLLFVLFTSGAMYQYADIDKKAYSALLNAESAGRFVRHITSGKAYEMIPQNKFDEVLYEQQGYPELFDKLMSKYFPDDTVENYPYKYEQIYLDFWVKPLLGEIKDPDLVLHIFDSICELGESITVKLLQNTVGMFPDGVMTDVLVDIFNNTMHITGRFVQKRCDYYIDQYKQKLEVDYAGICSHVESLKLEETDK